MLNTYRETPGGDDPYLWLEDVAGEDALNWVRRHNAATVTELADHADFARSRSAIREVLDAEDRIPYVTRRGDHLYNFWRDANHPRGVWRRTTLAEYRRDEPAWDTLLDVDAVAADEDENWIFKGAGVLRPGYDRALISLSRGGADATVVREFDLTTRTFVPDGFALPEAKNHVSWIDEDHVYVATDFGPGTLTSSGYPRIVTLWKRGTPLAESETVYAGELGDVGVGVGHDPTPGFERSVVERSVDFFHSEYFVLAPDDELVRLDIPLDAIPSLHRQWLLIRTRSPWRLGGTEYPAGALLVVELARFLTGEQTPSPVFLPDAHTVLDDYSWTHSHLLLTTLSDVTSSLRVVTPEPTTSGVVEWCSETIPTSRDARSVRIAGTDPDHSDEFFLDVSGFVQPSTLLRAHLGTETEVLKHAPAFFDASHLSVTQYYARSADGTRIPYFVVDGDHTGSGPTLLHGYGGFEIALTPAYLGIVGRGWLTRGGTYVVANIRGGGEYGPEWHATAMKENRHRAYSDFAAVASDLVERGITTPGRLGVWGRSNGGLLAGVMLTRYPELFGAVVSQVPLLDMGRFHTLLAGASWMAEYGDPDDPEEWAFISEYSPYHNIADRNGAGDQHYPPTLLTTSTRDDRVHPAHARKMMARMSAAGHDVRYYENIEGGHAGGADNDQLAFVWALIFEFLRTQLSS